MTRSKNSKNKLQDPKEPGRGLDLGFLIWDLRHGFRKNGADLSRRAAVTLLVLLFLIWLLASAYLVLVSQTILAARGVQDLRDQLTSLHKENAILEWEITKLQSPVELRLEAEAKGYGPTVRIEVVEP